MACEKDTLSYLWSNRVRKASHRVTVGTALMLGACLGLPTAAQVADTGPRADVLQAGFINPPTSARPRVWWHWMNGNITQEGIREDLEWMKRVGIAGVQNFDASLVTPKI